MKNLINNLLLLSISIILTSCAHHKDVRPGGASGEHSVVVKSKTQQEGVRESIAQATHYCKQFNQTPKIIKEGKKYQGDINEDVYKQSKKLKEAASVFLGGLPEGQKMSQAADKYLGDPYATEVKFKCE